MNVVEPILFQAKHDPPAPAMCAPGTAMGVVSYARLARFIHNVGRRAISAGISPGDVVILQVKDHIFHTSLAVGLMYIGVATVSLSGALPGHLPCDFIITDTPRSYANGKNAKILAADFAWISGDGIPVDERHVYRGAGNDICRIALTSGSIGEPKVVGFTHNNQLARLARYNHLFGRIFPECSRFFSDYGFGSSGGFRHILYVLSRGGTMFFPGASPMDTLQTFELCKVQGLIASPGGLSGFLKFYDANPAFRSGFEVIIAAGSPLHSSLSERVRARLCSNLISYYGTTETSTVSSALAHALTGIVGAVGHVAPDVSVRALSMRRGRRCRPVTRAWCLSGRQSASPATSIRAARAKLYSATGISIRAISATSLRTECWSSPGGKRRFSTSAATRSVLSSSRMPLPHLEASAKSEPFQWQMTWVLKRCGRSSCMVMHSTQTRCISTAGRGFPRPTCPCGSSASPRFLAMRTGSFKGSGCPPWRRSFVAPGSRCGRIPQQSALKNAVGTMTCVGFVRMVEVTGGGC